MHTFHSIDAVPRDGITTTGGRKRVRRCIGSALVALTLSGASLSASEQSGEQNVTVHEERGIYTVTAEFVVPQGPALAATVLTDYEEIPRFIPDVQKSIIVERTAGFIMVEQEAVARIFMFSKRVHLLLEVQHQEGEIRFRDRAAKSFTRYEGMWQIAQADGQTAIKYRLAAEPAFEVPQFLLARLLKRDARRMIDALRTEIALRETRARTSRPGNEQDCRSSCWSSKRLCCPALTGHSAGGRRIEGTMRDRDVERAVAATPSMIFDAIGARGGDKERSGDTS